MSTPPASKSPAQDHQEWLLRAIVDRAARLGKTRDPRQAEALAETAAAAWSAARYLEALAQAAPEIANQIAGELETELNDGDYLETAADTAERLGYDVPGWVLVAHLNAEWESRR